MTSRNVSTHGSPLVDMNVTSFDREYLHWSLIIVEVGAVVVIVVGDISMLMMFFTRKLLGQSTNILVFSVAIGDLVIGLLAVPLAMLQKVLLEPSEFLCKGYFYFANVSKTAVGYTILLLAMERIIAVLIHTFRILPPGRCLFFASLTWFFAAAYNIWSVVIYDVEMVTLTTPGGHQRDMFLCFASRRFMYIHEIFGILNPLVTFTLPALCSTLLFFYFVWKKHEADKPGRPYKSSKSVVVFTFALLISFVASQLPFEIATLVLKHDDTHQDTRPLVAFKVLHLISFSRGFWDIFIFGAFRHYVCKKEKALAHFREQRSLQVQRSSLAIPLSDRPVSTSLLDSDPSVSRRYSSDISRRPSALEESCIKNHGEHSSDSHQQQLPQQPLEQQQQQQQPQLPSEQQGLEDSQNGACPISLTPPRLAQEDVIVVFPQGYLIPRSPCASSDDFRSFHFPLLRGDSRVLPHHRPPPTHESSKRTGSCDTLNESPDTIEADKDALSWQKLEHRRKSCGDKAFVSSTHLLKGVAHPSAFLSKVKLSSMAERAETTRELDASHPRPPATGRVSPALDSAARAPHNTLTVPRNVFTAQYQGSHSLAVPSHKASTTGLFLTPRPPCAGD